MRYNVYLQTATMPGNFLQTIKKKLHEKCAYNFFTFGAS